MRSGCGSSVSIAAARGLNSAGASRGRMVLAGSCGSVSAVRSTTMSADGSGLSLSTSGRYPICVEAGASAEMSMDVSCPRICRASAVSAAVETRATCRAPPGRVHDAVAAVTAQKANPTSRSRWTASETIMQLTSRLSRRYSRRSSHFNRK